MRYWLMKSEPAVYGMDDLVRDGVTGWEGVRNYQARNMMRDEMRPGDLALFYHSNVNVPCVVGIMRVLRGASADETALDAGSPYYDARDAKNGKTGWVKVDLVFVERFMRVVPLGQMREDVQLAGLMVTQKGRRLSVQPVSEKHFRRICVLGGAQVCPA